MRTLLLTFIFLSLTACNTEKKATSKAEVSSASASSQSVSGDDFSDLKKEDDESCDTEEELQKKIEEDLQKKETGAFKLQGGDAGCDTGATKEDSGKEGH